MKERSLGILLARGPGTDDARLALDLVRAARERGTRVHLFLMGEGVDLLDTTEIADAVGAGADVAVCSRTALGRRRSLDRPAIDYASQHRLAQIVATADRFVSIT